MANAFLNLPMPAGGNGAGAAVDVSSMAWGKTIVCTGAFGGASITVEVSVDGGTTFAPIETFTESRGYEQQGFAAEFMRVVVRGFNVLIPFSAEVNVAAPVLTGAAFANLPVPAGDGFGASVDVSTFPDGITCVVGGTFPGTSVDIEMSTDGGTTFVPIKTFNGQGGIASFPGLSPEFMRVAVRGRRNPAPFTAVVDVGATPGSTGGSPPPPPASGAPEFLPEIWQQQDVPNTQTVAAAMACGVSQLFDDFEALRDGSIIGVIMRLSAGPSAGSLTARVTINGVATALSVTIPVGFSSGPATVAAGVIPYTAGNEIGVTLEVSAGFAPNGSIDAEVWVEVQPD